MDVSNNGLVELNLAKKTLVNFVLKYLELMIRSLMLEIRKMEMIQNMKLHDLREQFPICTTAGCGKSCRTPNPLIEEYVKRMKLAASATTLD